MIRLVLFDIDGTLVRTGGAGIKAFAKVFATEFNASDGFEKLKFAGRTDVSLVREFFDHHAIALTPESLDRFFESYVFWLDYILAHSDTATCAGVREFIAGLKSLPHPPILGLLTGNIRLAAEIKLCHFNLWREFETGAFADDNEDRNQIAAVARERGFSRAADKLFRTQSAVSQAVRKLELEIEFKLNAKGELYPGVIEKVLGLVEAKRMSEHYGRRRLSRRRSSVIGFCKIAATFPRASGASA